MRSVHVQKDKTIFKLSELPAEAYAASMGLPGAPQIKLLEGKAAKTRGPTEVKEVAEEATSRQVVGSDESEDEEEFESEDSSADGNDKENSDSESSSDQEQPKVSPFVQRKVSPLMTETFNCTHKV